jgi:long-chain acyl-CoA synthetase
MSLNLALMLREAARTHPEKAALRPGRRATETELVEHVRERVASYKYPARLPRSVEFREHLPMNATGKILKREL